jgi:hypothetical protein
MTMPEDPELESFLRQFRPRSPAPWPKRRLRQNARHWLLPAAAALVAATAVWQWAPGSRVTPHPSPAPGQPGAGTTLGVAHLALNPGSPESVLDEINLRALPDPTRPGGALRVLGNVSRDTHEPGTGSTP